MNCGNKNFSFHSSNKWLNFSMFSSDNTGISITSDILQANLVIHSTFTIKRMTGNLWIFNICLIFFLNFVYFFKMILINNSFGAVAMTYGMLLVFYSYRRETKSSSHKNRYECVCLCRSPKCHRHVVCVWWIFQQIDLVAQMLMSSSTSSAGFCV